MYSVLTISKEDVILLDHRFLRHQGAFHFLVKRSDAERLKKKKKSVSCTTTITTKLPECVFVHDSQVIFFRAPVSHELGVKLPFEEKEQRSQNGSGSSEFPDW